MAGNKSYLETVQSQDATNNGIAIGVLALQGAFEKHVEMLNSCGVNAIRIRTPSQIDMIDGLIIPGGESTTVGKLMVRYGIDEKLINRAHDGMPIFGTCTGLILMAKNILNSDQYRLDLMDISVVRNAFGRQIDSFESNLDIEAIGQPQFRAVFIRAPYVQSVGANVDVLAEYDSHPVLVREGNLLGCAFHPELTDDKRLHMYFISMVQEYLSNKETLIAGENDAT